MNDSSEDRARSPVVPNPNCSEIVFKLGTMSKDEALTKLREAGILEISIPFNVVTGKNDDKDGKWTVFADKDNPFVPDMDSEFGSSQIKFDDWMDTESTGISIIGEINLEDTAFPTLKKIQDAFPDKEWEEAIGGSTTCDFYKWVANGCKPFRKRVGKETKRVRKEFIDKVFAAQPGSKALVEMEMNRVPENPNCSEIVFELPGMTREEALGTLANLGIIEVDVPYPIPFRSDFVFHVLADNDNEFVPNFEEYNSGNLSIETFKNALVIRGSINIDERAFTTMYKIEQAFAGNTWEDLGGSIIDDEYREWKGNGMPPFTGEVDASTKTIRETIVKPELGKLVFNPNCSEVVILFEGMTVDQAKDVLSSIGIHVIPVLHRDVYSITSTSAGPVLFDDDNPNCPNFTFKESISFKHDDHAFKFPYLYTSDVEYSQFPTLLKIVTRLGKDLRPYDGGTTSYYDEWRRNLDRGKGKIPGNIQNERGVKLRDKYLYVAP